MLIEYDDKTDIIIPGDANTTLEYATNHWIKIAKTSISKNNKFSVALSGGKTPLYIYEKLSQKPYIDRIDWSKVFLFWGDERQVPSDNPESNYFMAMQAGLIKIPIPKNQIFKMNTLEKIEENSLEYEELIQNNLGKNLFDLVMLGVGKDGHIASLFPNTKALKVKDRLVTENYVKELNAFRLTITFECINNSSNIVIYAVGEEKKQIINTIFSSEEKTLPVQKIGSKKHKVTWILDSSSGEFFNNYLKK